ncbi:MAG: hypothetical protein R2789_19045 [Microthrixaceae bacterium]
MRFWMSGADVMPADVARRFKSFGSIASLPLVGALGETAFVEGYGMVEVAGGSGRQGVTADLPLGLGDSLGVPAAGLEVPRGPTRTARWCGQVPPVSSR